MLFAPVVSYDSWGRPLSCTGSLASTLGAANPLRYRGYIYDGEYGFYYLQSRYYNPYWGRFISADNVLCKTGGLLTHNLYAYCLNNPINLTDPDGHDPDWILKVIDFLKECCGSEAAKLLGVTSKATNKYINGTVKPAIRKPVHRLANALRSDKMINGSAGNKVTTYHENIQSTIDDIEKQKIPGTNSNVVSWAQTGSDIVKGIWSPGTVLGEEIIGNATGRELVILETKGYASEIAGYQTRGAIYTDAFRGFKYDVGNWLDSLVGYKRIH